ncbi:hypothetical protein EVA_21098, partial [gut metagenome]
MQEEAEADEDPGIKLEESKLYYYVTNRIDYW